MRYGFLAGLVASTMVGSAVAVPAIAAPPALTFHVTSPATANWAQTSDSDGDGWAIHTVLPNAGAYSFDVPVMGRPRLTATSPDFQFRGTQTVHNSPSMPPCSPCQNGPAMSIFFRDGTSIGLEVAFWVPNVWRSATNSPVGFLDLGGWRDSWGCGPIAGMSYSQLLTTCPETLQKTVSQVTLQAPCTCGFDTTMDYDTITFGQKTFTKPQSHNASG